MTKKFIFLLFVVTLCFIKAKAQTNPKWIFRTGATGTGTFDDGIWVFNNSSGLGAQTFTFQNSWGFLLEADYLAHSNWLTGVHLAISPTDFQLAIEENGSTSIHKDKTSFHVLLLEEKYLFAKGKAFRPFLGITGGLLWTKDLEFSIRNQSPTKFTFQNPFIYGFVFGADWEIGKKAWLLHFGIRGLTFDYTLEKTNLTDHQTLLDQVFWMNFNHLQLGVGKRF